MSNNTHTSTSGGGGMFLLFLVFLVLKLTGYIDWSWWWVTAPLWIPFLIFIVVVIGVLIFTSRRR